MGDGNDRALILLQMLFQPVDRLCVEVVGRLVEKQDVGFLKEQPAEGYAAALTPREVGDGPVARRTVQGVHSALQLGVHVPGVGSVDDVLQLGLACHEFVHLVGILIIFGQAELHVDVVVLLQGVVDVMHALLDVLLHGLRLVEGRVLRQVAHGVAGAPYHLPLVLLIQSGNNLHERRLTGTVQTDDANLRAVEETEVDVLQYLFLVLLNGLAHADHREYHFLVVNCCHGKTLYQ